MPSTAEKMETATDAAASAAPDDARTVFIFLRGGILVRNFVNRDMLRILQESGHHFVIFSPDPDHPYLARHFSHPCFVLERMETAQGQRALWSSRWGNFLVQVRRFTYGDTRFSENGCRQSLIKAFECEQMASSGPLGKLFYRSILWTAAAASRWRPVRRLLTWLENRTVPFDAHGAQYRRYRPSMTIVTSLGFDQDTLVMREARRYGAPVTVLVKNWDVPTTRGIGSVVPDHVLVWNTTMRDEVVRYHDVPAGRIAVTGISQWDHYFRDDVPACPRAAFLERYGLRDDRKTIYYAMTTPSHYRQNVTLARRLLEAIRNGDIAGPAQLLVRLHPAYVLIGGMLSDEIRSELESLEQEYGDILAYSLPTSDDHDGFLVPGDQDELDLKDILTHSDVMVTVYSTQILEGAIFGMPIVNAGMFEFRETGSPIATYEEWDHIRQVLDRDAVAYCYSMNGVVAAVNTALAEPERGHEARRRLAERLFHAELRGRGGEATACALLDILEKGAARL
jgi:hypothetical protein